VESDQEQQIKIPIRDKRKVHLSDDGGASIVDASPPVAEEPADNEEVAIARRQAAGYLDDLQRLKAEFDNYRKRTLREQTRLIEMAAVGTIAQLLGVLDHFDLAMAAARQTQDYEKMVKGVEMVHSELKEVLRNSGLEIIDAEGKPFDPNLHEAVGGDEGDGSGVMVVGQLLRNGYKFKDMVLRPAMVRVTQSAEAAQQEATSGAARDGKADQAAEREASDGR
jgi:molecular chaperone GrpE